MNKPRNGRSIGRPTSAPREAGRVLQFRRKSEPHEGGERPAAESRGLPDGVLAALWLGGAWLIALLRLDHAVARHESFGVDVALALLIAIVWPLARWKTWWHGLHELVRRRTG